MTIRRLLALAALLLPVGLAAAPASAAEAPAEVPLGLMVPQLLADPALFDGATIAVRGELVGDFGERDDGSVWVQLNGDTYADAPLVQGGALAGYNLGIGARVPAGEWPDLEQPGGYRVRGPIVTLTGTWRYHDPGRSGESYLDVAEVRVLSLPWRLEEGLDWLPLGLGLGLLAAAGAVAAMVRRRRAD